MRFMFNVVEMAWLGWERFDFTFSSKKIVETSVFQWLCYGRRSILRNFFSHQEIRVLPVTHMYTLFSWTQVFCDKFTSVSKHTYSLVKLARIQWKWWKKWAISEIWYYFRVERQKLGEWFKFQFNSSPKKKKSSLESNSFNEVWHTYVWLLNILFQVLSPN